MYTYVHEYLHVVILVAAATVQIYVAPTVYTYEWRETDASIKSIHRHMVSISSL